jgi:large subunit ribosomal protein L10
MTRDQKVAVVESLKEQFANSQFFYLADSSQMTVAEVNDLRRLCHEKGVSLSVVKNTLVKKAFESIGDDYEDLYPALSGPTSVMFSEVSNLPAKVIKEFRKGNEKPLLKAAWIDSDVFLGDEMLSTLSDLKSKEELVGEIIGLLQSPAKNVVSALSSASGKLTGILQTLGEREEA